MNDTWGPMFKAISGLKDQVDTISVDIYDLEKRMNEIVYENKAIHPFDKISAYIIFHRKLLDLKDKRRKVKYRLKRLISVSPRINNQK